MAFDLRSLQRRYALAEALSQSLTFRGFNHLPGDIEPDRGIVALLQARRYRPQLVVLHSSLGGWWFVGVQRERPREIPCPWWPFLCARISYERLEEARRQLEQRGALH